MSKNIKTASGFGGVGGGYQPSPFSPGNAPFGLSGKSRGVVLIFMRMRILLTKYLRKYVKTRINQNYLLRLTYLNSIRMMLR